MKTDFLKPDDTGGNVGIFPRKELEENRLADQIILEVWYGCIGMRNGSQLHANRVHISW